MKRGTKRTLVAILGICTIVGTTPVLGNTSYAAAENMGIESQENNEVEGSPYVDEAEQGQAPENNNEITDDNQDVDESQSGIEDSTGDKGDSDSIPEDEAVNESDNGIVQQQAEEPKGQAELKENSWRYQEGNLIQGNEITPRSSYPNAWNKVNGAYMNSVGEVIEGATHKGIDVSQHQGQIDWAKVKADGIDFAIIRCGFGDNYASQDDKCWQYNVSECERLGIPYGVYIYSYATNTTMAKSEAEHVLRLIKGRSFSYPVYFDMEDDSTVGISSELKGQIAKTFCDTVTAAGYKVGIYANLNWWTTYLTSDVFNNTSWSKWVAQYNTTCDYSGAYDIWQCTSKGSVAGITGDVDLNFWMNGSIDYGSSGTTLAVRRGNEYHFKYTLTNGAADRIVTYGRANDTVLVGDWDGDGVDTLCVRRGNVYHFKNSLSDGVADEVVGYGKPGDTVFVGDWNGDGVDTLCVRRGNLYYFKNDLSGGEADSVVAYGRASDTILVGDWNGDGVDTLCVRRGNLYYFKNSLLGGEADSVVAYGRAYDTILVGDWNDDNLDTLCVRRDNYYHIKNSIDGGAADRIVAYGRKDDIIYVGKWR